MSSILEVARLQNEADALFALSTLFEQATRHPRRVIELSTYKPNIHDKEDEYTKAEIEEMCQKQVSTFFNQLSSEVDSLACGLPRPNSISEKLDFKSPGASFILSHFYSIAKTHNLIAPVILWVIKPYLALKDKEPLWDASDDCIIEGTKSAHAYFTEIKTQLENSKPITKVITELKAEI